MMIFDYIFLYSCSIFFNLWWKYYIGQFLLQIWIAANAGGFSLSPTLFVAFCIRRKPGHIFVRRDHDELGSQVHRSSTNGSKCRGSYLWQRMKFMHLLRINVDSFCIISQRLAPKKSSHNESQLFIQKCT